MNNRFISYAERAQRAKLRKESHRDRVYLPSVRRVVIRQGGVGGYNLFHEYTANNARCEYDPWRGELLVTAYPDYAGMKTYPMG